MPFNELNSVEHYIVHKISGENLNESGVAEPEESYGKFWKYKSAKELERSVNEVLLEEELKKALKRLNPEINARPELADEVIYKLRAIIIAVNETGLVRANEEFFKWLRGDKTMPFGENNRHVPVKLIEFGENKLENNSYIITNQYRIHNRETKIPDVVMFINGIPGPST